MQHIVPIKTVCAFIFIGILAAFNEDKRLGPSGMCGVGFIANPTAHIAYCIGDYTCYVRLALFGCGAGWLAKNVKNLIVDGRL